MNSSNTPKTSSSFFLILIPFLILASCQISTDKEKREEHISKTNDREGWLKGNEHEILDLIEEQFGGFDQSMIEIYYRYKELYMAGSASNWEYAAYQLDEMTETFEKGFIRRPARKASAEHFINVSIPDVLQSINTQSYEMFENSFKALTIACNNCHAIEEVGFIKVEIPSLP